jgi:hypothetical protein
MKYPYFLFNLVLAVPPREKQTEHKADHSPSISKVKAETELQCEDKSVEVCS